MRTHISRSTHCRTSSGGQDSTEILPALSPLLSVDLHERSIAVIGEALVCIRMQPLLFWLKVFLFQGGWSLVVHSQSHGPPEVTIPLKITDTESGMKSSDRVSYSLKIEGQRHVVHMKLAEHLFARNMPVFTYTDQGALLGDYPFIQDDCYFHGYMDEDPESMVSLSTCSGGFQGIIAKDKNIYKIEPKPYSTNFQHLIYKLDDKDKEFPARKCDLTDKEIQRQMRYVWRKKKPPKNMGYKIWWTHKRYFPVGYVVSRDLFEFFERNVSDTESKIIFMHIIINNIYRRVEMKPIITGIEIWSERDFVYAFTSYDTLKAFCTWKERSFNLRVYHHTAYFLIHHEDTKAFSKAFQKTACRPTLNCVCTNYRRVDNLHIIAFAIVHQIGHVLGFNHDDGDYCYCPDEMCIMNSKGRLAIKFSNCTYSQYYIMRTECYFIPVPKERYFRQKECGNGVLEEGEDCDCGTIKSCAKDPCCETNCTLTRESVCAFGLCCKDCKISPAGTLCRKEENECDLPEWCNGTTSQCPEDVYVQGGISCKGGGYCHEKRCNNRDEQCRSIFGEQAKNANLSCYIESNVRGDRFGNCGIDSVKYTPCHIRDSLCGRIQCENVEQIPSLINHTTYILTNFSGLSCWSSDFHAGLNEPDIGEVKDGTECGENHICFERQCVSKLKFTKRCSPLKCNMHGICNNKHHCHCDPTWRPPFCYDAGVGGSVDSGPPPGNFSHDYDYSTEYAVIHTHACFFLLLLRLFLFLLTLLIIVLKGEKKKVSSFPEKKESGPIDLKKKKQVP